MGCATSGICLLTTTLTVLSWGLILSALLFYTWNKVIADLFKAKEAKFWQALLIVATLIALCFPRYYMKGKYMGHHKKCCQGKMMMDGGKMMGHGNMMGKSDCNCPNCPGKKM